MTGQSAMFGHGAWWGYRFPFRHFRATDVLNAEGYGKIASAFGSILDMTARRGDAPYRLTRSNPNYDALMLAMDQQLAPSFAPFFSSDWLTNLQHFFGLPEMGQVDGGLHSSPKGSRTGWIHTDLCSGWFHEEKPPDGSILFPAHMHCEYFTGRPKVESARPMEYIRAATLIYYLCNDGWQPGDGGETALYPSARPVSQSAVHLVPPLNNSLLLFECSPHSYHRFVANPGRPRNSLILWLHCTVEHAQSRWGTAVNRRGS
jgi:hypothetical protein